MSYKEFEGGQCWQVDPVSDNAKETNLGDNGGWYKSIDNTNTMNPIFSTTEDHDEGAIHHFVANGRGCSLHSNRDEQFLRIIMTTRTNGQLTRVPHEIAPAQRKIIFNGGERSIELR